jgi:hypothetical protein
MTTETTKILGYAVKTVADRIAAMDIDAQGNAEKAAWKRYMGLSMLALAKGVAKKNMATAVFGKDAKSSKNFDNMWSLAEKARNNPLLLGNRSWDEVRVMSIDEALDTVIGMVNTHMNVLNVGGKNAYGPICGMSLEEIEAKKANDEADAKAEADEKAAKIEADADAAKVAEDEARSKADARPERTPAEAAIGALGDASRDDLMSVMAHIATRLSLEDLQMMQMEIAAMVANAQASAEQAEGEPEAIAA